MTKSSYRVLHGSSVPLGAHWDGSGVNFALFSANATKVELCLFDTDGQREIGRIQLPEYTHEVWHGYLPDIRPGQRYGYRVHGPYEPQAGHRFNPNKLLLDPYALELRGEMQWHDSCFGYTIGAPEADLSFDERDSAPYMPKCVVIDPAVTWGNDIAPNVPWAETVIYEAHVKGMTALRQDLRPELRGTFDGLADPRTIDHLVKLGVTSVELMPVQTFFDDRYLIEKGLTNYWGYNTAAFFAPATRYISKGGNIHEFKLLVRRLHEAGIEVIMDVVYNHTAEGSELGPTISLRGIDNASYYVMADDPRYYFETTGCGNNLNLRHERVLQMVMDSLRYWVTECHVDGFRFDLASTLGRDRDKFDGHAVFLDAVRQDPVLARAKLIAEPWDTGPDGYQVGNFPPGWAEWNDKYRDTVRSFWKGDEGKAAGLASNLLGSAGLFDRRGRRPWASVNFVTAHDGFTLTDVVSFNEKHNLDNKEDNRDGNDSNESWNCGAEGMTEDEDILNLRDRMKRNLVATTLLSQGTPMLLMGDENGRSQGGNNNSYCQDNEMNWLHWDGVGPRDLGFQRFVSNLVHLRRTRPLLRSRDYLHGTPVDESGTPDVRWLRPDGKPMTEEDWGNGLTRSMAILFAGPRERFLLLLNAYHETIGFKVPKGLRRGWVKMVDTATGQSAVEREDGEVFRGSSYAVEGRSLILLESRG